MQKYFLAALVVAAGCSQEPADENVPPQPPVSASAPAAEPDETPEPALAGLTAAGEVNWPADAALPEDAFLRVTLLDVSRADASAETLSEATYPISGGPPVIFSLTTAKAIDPGARLSVRAEISDGAALLFASGTQTPVSPVDGAGDLAITLAAVDPAPGSGAGGKAVTPVSIAYQCGDEAVDIAIEEGAAYVTSAGGETATLQRISGGPGAPQSFSDGRVTVFLDGSGIDGPRMRLARGRAAPLDCVRSE